MTTFTTGHDYYARLASSRTATEDVASFRIPLPRQDRDQRLRCCFQRGDRIAIRAEGHPGAPEIAVLDTFFRPLRVERSGGQLRFVARESGVLYLVVPGGVPIGALRVSRRRRVRGRETSLLARVVEWLLARCTSARPALDLPRNRLGPRHGVSDLAA